MPFARADRPELTIALDGRPEWTRPVYEGVLAAPEARKRYVGVSGGSGSGKTFALGEASVLAMLRWNARVV